MSPPAVPPGWPVAVRPPGSEGFARSATGWLFDLCPGELRGHAVLARHPVALARLAALHVAAAHHATRRALATVRTDLGPVLTPEALAGLVEALELEEARLLAAGREVGLVEQALRGHRYVPRL